MGQCSAVVAGLSLLAFVQAGCFLVPEEAGCRSGQVQKSGLCVDENPTPCEDWDCDGVVGPGDLAFLAQADDPQQDGPPKGGTSPREEAQPRDEAESGEGAA
jgi:hypothetical protein